MRCATTTCDSAWMCGRRLRRPRSDGRRHSDPAAFPFVRLPRCARRPVERAPAVSVPVHRVDPGRSRRLVGATLHGRRFRRPQRRRRAASRSGIAAHSRDHFRRLERASRRRDAARRDDDRERRGADVRGRRSIPPGETVTLTATPDPESRFAGWSGTVCTGTASTCSFFVVDDVTVAAHFTRKPVRLSVSTVGAGTVTSIPRGISCRTRCSYAVAPAPR